MDLVLQLAQNILDYLNSMRASAIIQVIRDAITAIFKPKDSEE